MDDVSFFENDSPQETLGSLGVYNVYITVPKHLYMSYVYIVYRVNKPDDKNKR